MKIEEAVKIFEGYIGEFEKYQYVLIDSKDVTTIVSKLALRNRTIWNFKFEDKICLVNPHHFLKTVGIKNDELINIIKARITYDKRNNILKELGI